MPRLTRVRIGAIEDLLTQLRFAPAGTARRHLENAERLAREIDPERNYPVVELARRITGLRADPEEIEDATVVGRALAGELSALIERLSDLAGLRMEDLGEGAMRLSELCARWGVDRKTIERWRRLGLIGHRVVVNGRRGLGFRRSWVEAFEKKGDVVMAGGRSRAARTARVGRAEREEIVRRAARAAEGGLTRSAAALRAARETGRSHEAARRAIAREERARGGRLFEDRGRVGARERLVAARAAGRGMEMWEIARALGRSRASAHRVVLEGRLARLAALRLECATSEMFGRRDAADVLLAPSAAREGLAPPAREEWSVWVARARGQRALREEEERAMGAALCYLRWRAARRIEVMREAGVSAARVDGVETELRWAGWLAGAMGMGQSFVALRNLEERLGAGAETLSGERARMAHEHLQRALVRGALAFDPFRSGRGSRLAGVTTVLVTRAMQWLGERGALLSVREGAARARGVMVEDASWKTVEWSWLMAGPTARERAAGLEARVREVVRLRWGIEGEEGVSEPPMTRRAVSARLNAGAARIARSEREWLRGGGVVP